MCGAAAAAVRFTGQRIRVTTGEKTGEDGRAGERAGRSSRDADARDHPETWARYLGPGLGLRSPETPRFAHRLATFDEAPDENPK